MWFRAFSAPGRRVRPRRPGGSAQRGAQMCPLGERAPSYALWAQQGWRAAFFLFFAAARLRSVPAARPERPDPAGGAHATRARRRFPSNGRGAKAAGAASTSGTQTWLGRFSCAQLAGSWLTWPPRSRRCAWVSGSEADVTNRQRHVTNRHRAQQTVRPTGWQAAG